MPEALPSSAEQLAKVLDFAGARDVDPLPFCGCDRPLVIDRVCRACKLPNLAALLVWRANGCACAVPNNRMGQIILRVCRTCERTIFDT